MTNEKMKALLIAMAAITAMTGSAVMTPSVNAQELTMQAKSIEKHTSGNYVYRISAYGNCKVLSYTGKEKNVVVPEKLDGHPVAEIERDAFANCNTIKKLTLPKGLKVIETNAITKCKNLETLSLPKSLETIYESRVDVSEQQIELFSDCPKLKNIKVASGNKHYADADGVTSFTEYREWGAIAIPIKCISCDNICWFDDTSIPNDIIYECECPICKTIIKKQKKRWARTNANCKENKNISKQSTRRTILSICRYFSFCLE